MLSEAKNFVLTGSLRRHALLHVRSGDRDYSLQVERQKFIPEDVKILASPLTKTLCFLEFRFRTNFAEISSQHPQFDMMNVPKPMRNLDMLPERSLKPLS